MKRLLRHRIVQVTLAKVLGLYLGFALRTTRWSLDPGPIRWWPVMTEMCCALVPATTSCSTAGTTSCIQLRADAVGYAVNALLQTAASSEHVSNQFRVGLYPFIRYLYTYFSLTTNLTGTGSGTITNAAANLAWGTRAENVEDKIFHVGQDEKGPHLAGQGRGGHRPNGEAETERRAV